MKNFVSASNSSFSSFLQNFKFVSAVNDPRIGELSIYKRDCEGKDFIAISSRELDRESTQMFKQELALRVSSSHPNIIQVHEYEILEKGSNFHCKLAIEWYQQDLEMELKKRISLKVKS